MREFLGPLTQHTESNEKDINYQKFTLKRARRHKPNQSYTQRSDLYQQKKKTIAFGSSVEKVKEELKLPPLAIYEVSYQQIDANIPKVKIHTERNYVPKLQTETTLKSVNCTITRQRANSMQKQPQLQPLQLKMPKDYLPLRHYQPLSLQELSCIFDNLLVKHKITKPSLPLD